MPATIHRVEYFYLTVKDQPGEGYRLLSRLASGGVELLAFNAVPLGGHNTQLIVFPASRERLLRVAETAGLVLSGPQNAFLIQGDDELGALVDIHQKLYDARINVSASSGVTDGRGGYGYVIYVGPESYEGACRALGA